jgi:hypothetical protein
VTIRWVPAGNSQLEPAKANGVGSAVYLFRQLGIRSGAQEGIFGLCPRAHDRGAIGNSQFPAPAGDDSGIPAGAAGDLGIGEPAQQGELGRLSSGALETERPQVMARPFDLHGDNAPPEPAR